MIFQIFISSLMYIEKESNYVLSPWNAVSYSILRFRIYLSGQVDGSVQSQCIASSLQGDCKVYFKLSLPLLTLLQCFCPLVACHFTRVLFVRISSFILISSFRIQFMQPVTSITIGRWQLPCSINATAAQAVPKKKYGESEVKMWERNRTPSRREVELILELLYRYPRLHCTCITYGS